MIEIRGLAKTYADGKVALRHLDLDIGAGMWGLLGPNGAGKTTFLSILVLALEPSHGRRIYDGIDAAHSANRGAIRRAIGYLPQSFAPIGHLSGLEYVEHCARLREVPLSSRALRRRVLELLEQVGLTAAAHRRSGTYSGGMKRRLGMAQAIVHTPRLLVVDEPTAGLDPEERIRFRNLVSDVAESTAVLLSTHIVEDVEATCPRIGIIGRGALLFEGEPSTLLHQANGRLWEIAETAPLPSGAAVVARRLSAGGKSVVVIDAPPPVPGATAREPTLEEAYSAFLVRHGESQEELAPLDVPH